MVNSLATRLFQYKCIDHIITSNESAFSTGSHWTSFSRWVGPHQLHMKHALERVFDFEAGWHDTVKALYRAVWCGDHDVELCRLSNLLSGSLDTQPVHDDDVSGGWAEGPGVETVVVVNSREFGTRTKSRNGETAN